MQPFKLPICYILKNAKYNYWSSHPTIGMKILWFNWRDIQNPDAGGAEVFTHEVMRRLAAMGHEMTLVTSEFEGCQSNANVDDVNIIRSGGKYSVYKQAKSFYKSHGSRYDVIIDEINTRPFLTPKFVRGKPIIALFHQLAREFWFYETSFPMNYLGFYYFENKWLSYYRDIPTVTVSDSSKKDLEDLGFKKIFMVPEGLNVTPLQEVRQKESVPTVVFMGRLKKAKLPHHAIQAFSYLRKEIPNAKMWIIGDGYMRSELENMRQDGVVFFGRVSNAEKYDLLSRAHVALVPAVREGWGLVVTEANAMGTPAVGYNVPGIRDSVRNGETGLLVSENTPKALGLAAASLLKDKEQLRTLSSNSNRNAKSFSWDTTAKEFDSLVRKICNQS